MKNKKAIKHISFAFFAMILIYPFINTILFKYIVQKSEKAVKAYEYEAHTQKEKYPELSSGNCRIVNTKVAYDKKLQLTVYMLINFNWINSQIIYHVVAIKDGQIIDYSEDTTSNNLSLKAFYERFFAIPLLHYDFKTDKERIALWGYFDRHYASSIVNIETHIKVYKEKENNIKNLYYQ